MATLPRLKYARPADAGRATPWAIEWRRRWIRNVGSVHEYYVDKSLIAFYSNDRDPKWRLALQSEIEARPNRIADVLAACRKASREFDAKIRGLSGGRISPSVQTRASSNEKGNTKNVYPSR